MRILVLVDSYPPHHSGGYELRCRDVMKGLADRGHILHVITTHYSKSRLRLSGEENHITRVLHKKSEASSVLQQIMHDFNDMRRIHHLVGNFKPDLVYLWHLGDLSNAIIPYFASRKFPIVYDEGGKGLIAAARNLKRGPYFFRNHQDSVFKKRAKSVINRMVCLLSLNRIQTKTAWPDEMRLMFNSKASLLYAQENGVPVHKASVIYSGVNLQRFQYEPRSVISDPVKILVPGRITAIKGTKDALSLFAMLHELNIRSELTIVGKGVSKDYYEEVEKMIRTKEYEERITLLPMFSHEKLAELYRENDVCFFPSYQKCGLSRVPIEAMASGCMVITYGNEGSQEIIANQKTGFIIQEGDFSSAAEIIHDLIQDPELCGRVTSMARSYVEREHSMEKYINSVESFLAEAVV